MPIIAASLLLASLALHPQGRTKTPTAPKPRQEVKRIQVVKISKRGEVDWSYIRTHQAAGLASLVQASKSGAIPKKAFASGLRPQHWETAVPFKQIQQFKPATGSTDFSYVIGIESSFITDSGFDLGTASHGYADYSRYASSNAKVTASIDGDPAFKVTGLHRKDWHDGQYGSPGSYTDYGVGPNASLSVTSGQEYEVLVELNVKSGDAGGRTATLIVHEGTVEIHVPLKTTVIKAQYSAQNTSLSPTSLKLQPHEEGKVAFSLDVKTNVPLNLTVQAVNAPNGVTADPVDLYTDKPAQLPGSVRIRVTDDALVDHTIPVMFGVFHEGKMLGSFVVPVKIWMKWSSWNYHLEAGNQTADGEVFVSSSGLYIWNVTLHNSSKFSPDTYMQSIAFDAAEPDGHRWGAFAPGALPIASVSTLTFHQTGYIKPLSIKAIMDGNLRTHLTIQEGGLLASIEQSFKTWFGSGITIELSNGDKQKVVDSMGSEFAKWWIENKVRAMPATRIWMNW